MIEGQCSCGKVRYQYDGEITEVSMCHCTQCRLAQGTASGPVCPVDNRKLTITGAEHIKEYESSPGKVRAFCSHCGSPLYSARTNLPDVKRIRAGTITTPFTCANQFHIFTDSKASWHDITDNYPQHKGNKPG